MTRNAPELGKSNSGGPRFLTEWPDTAVGTLADELLPWLADQGGMSLRPWQSDVLRLAWCVEPSGRLCFRTVVISTPRQSGKSWLARAWATARVHHPHLFGDEPQLVAHLAHRHAAARRIHAQAWGWAYRQGLTVRTGVGSERIIWPDGGSWDTSTLHTVYGASCSAVILDEIWGVSPDGYREAVLPTQAARRMPQLLAVSTAHPKSTALPAQLMLDGRLGLRRTMLADWGAHADDDPADPRVWQAASPHWDEQRAEEIALAVGSPAFASQWLNVWADDMEPWRWLPRQLTDIARASVDWPAAGVGVVGLESRWNQAEEHLPGRWAVAVAWPASVGVVARVERRDTLAEVAELVGDRRVHAHSSVVAQLAAFGRGWRCEPVNTTGSRSSGEVLAQLVRDRRLQVAGVDDVTWAGVRVTPSDAGDVVDARKSLADVASVKALGYAAAAASRAAHSGPVLVA